MNSEMIKAIRENERFLRHVLQIAGLGTYVMDIVKGTFTSSRILDDIFGLDTGKIHSYDDWVALLHPDDRPMLTGYYTREVLGQRQRFDKEYRIVRATDGAERWVHGYGDLECDADNHPITMIVTIQDITDRKRSEQALQQSECRYRELVALAVDGILLGSHEGIILEANQRMCEMIGLRREDLVGKHIRDVLFTPGSLKTTPLRFDLLQKGETVVRERQILRANGELAFVELRTKMMPDGTYQSIYRDVTERKTAETLLYNFAETLASRVTERTRELEEVNANLRQSVQQLRTNETLLREMGSISKVGGWELDIHTGKQIWTDEVYRIHEVGLDFEPTGENGIAFYSDESRPVIEKAVQRCIEQGEPYDLELQIVTAKGNRLWVHSVGKADIENGRIYGTFQDVTERRLSESLLRDKNMALDQSVAQLRTLAMELTQAEERERKRLAGILHDHVQQYIAAATMKISLLGSRMSAGERTRVVKETLSLLGEALDASRSLTVSLCPPVLLDAGLMPGLRWLVDWMGEKHGLAVTLTGDEVLTVPGSLNIILFQAVRELLFNVVKHAGVKKASVSLRQPQAGTLCLTVSDHGKGFAINESHGRKLSSGFGLFHLRERITHIGGSFTVTTGKGHGAVIAITIPLE